MEDGHSFFAGNAFITSFSNKEPVTLKTKSASLPSDTIKMVTGKDGRNDYFKDYETLFYSNNVAYRELNFMQASILHSGYYETQLQLTSNFKGFECNSVYTEFIANSSYLGISSGVVILQSTLQRMAYFGTYMY